MTFDQLMSQRWSCRAYDPEPVPDEVLDRVLATAQRTAS